MICLGTSVKALSRAGHHSTWRLSWDYWTGLGILKAICLHSDTFIHNEPPLKQTQVEHTPHTSQETYLLYLFIYLSFLMSFTCPWYLFCIVLSICLTICSRWSAKKRQWPAVTLRQQTQRNLKQKQVSSDYCVFSLLCFRSACVGAKTESAPQHSILYKVCE